MATEPCMLCLQMDYDQEYNMPIGMTPQRRTEEQRDPAKVDPEFSVCYIQPPMVICSQWALFT